MRTRIWPVLGLVILLQGCVIEVDGSDDYGNISHVFGHIDVRKGHSTGDVDSVNGSITLHDGASAMRVKSVNGSINVGDDVTFNAAHAVNGNIKCGRNLKVIEDISTVNGRIRVDRGGRIEGSIRNVNGDIDLVGTQVQDNLETVNGDVDLVKGTVIEGDVVFRDSGNHRDNRNRPTLHVDADSQIKGTLYLYRPVRLDLDEGAKVSRIERPYEDDDR